MEADMAREIFLDNPMFLHINVRLGTLIGDDDSSTIATLRKGVDYEIKKWSDKNHAVTKLSKCLYTMKLSTTLVKYFKYCFSCVLEKNKHDTEATKEGLLNIVPHAFDDHSKCGDWCAYKNDGEMYKHKILPGGKGLVNNGKINQEKLQAVFDSFAKNAEKLSPCASSQSNESLNRTIASKAPKMLHYGGSSSNDFRVAAAIIHKNIGNTSIEGVWKKIGSSPTTKSSKTFRVTADKTASLRKLKSKTILFKKRRRQLFDRKLNNNNKASRKEGICYESGCGLDLTIDFTDRPDSISKIKDYSSANIVLFDLETTGFGSNKEIIQIASMCDSKKFDIYIMPLHGISSQASEVTSLTVHNNVLFYNFAPVKSNSKQDTARAFIKFLQDCGSNVILIAHNCFTFDCPTIISFMKDEGLLDEFRSVVAGFSDSLPLFKEKLKDKSKGKVSYKQAVLAEKFLGSDSSAGAHNAIKDVEILQNLMEHPQINIKRDDILKNVKSIEFIIVEKSKTLECNALKQSLQCLQRPKGEKCGGLSSHMINKIASVGITLENLCQCYSSGGQKEIKILLAQDVGGKPRVTKSLKIVTELCLRLDSIKSA